MDPSLSQTITINISCKGLTSTDFMSKSDPYATLHMNNKSNSSSTSWIDLGRTETIRNNHEPKFVHDFNITYQFEEVQECLITIYDDDNGRSADDMLGKATFVLSTLMGSRGQKIRIPLRNSSGHIAGETIVSASTPNVGDNTTNINDILFVVFGCRNLDKKDIGLFSSSDPYFILEKCDANSNPLDEDSWIPLYKSETIKKNLNPQWKEFSIPVYKLQSGKLRIAIWDWDSSSDHDVIGYVNPITLSDIVTLQKKGLNVVHPPTKSKYQGSKYTSSGLFDIVSVRVQKGDPTFVEYLRSGLQIGLSVAVDFTGSNGSPDTPGTLHYGHGRTAVSPYMAAIRAVGKIVLDYDSDKLVPSFGFGARPYAGADVSHCFPLNGNEKNPSALGVEGILESYASTFDRGVVLSGPTHFAPVIRQVTSLTRNTVFSSSSLSYCILLLITDGAINDLQETIDAIVDASLNCPLSIIIVGVGNADFSSMQALDADVQPLTSSRGVQCKRDIVQFVPFNKFGGNSMLLAKETLAELPNQIVQWFWKQNGQAPTQSIHVEDHHASLVDVEISVAPVVGKKASVTAPPPISGGGGGGLGEIGRSLLQTAL
jgi:hypothetical protein